MVLNLKGEEKQYIIQKLDVIGSVLNLLNLETIPSMVKGELTLLEHCLYNDSKDLKRIIKKEET